MPEPVTEHTSTPSLANNRSKWKDFVASIATIRGDPSTITAPPFVLDTKSAVELPAYWAERPSIFVAPAASDDPAERAVLVLKWFIASLRNQQYAGRPADDGVKKPLNSFLGELFLARWIDDAATGKRTGITRLVSEQVSHHPPVTACRVWNEKHGVSAEGYTRQEITFSNTMNIHQLGHARFHLARHNETYLIPLPSVKIKGILTGSLYPELHGKYHIPSTSGHTSSIEFGGGGGKGWFSGWEQKHIFEAKVYRDDEANNKPLYTVKGNWDGMFTIHNARKGVDVETFDVRTAKTTPLTIEPLTEQDPWESRVAWREVREALERGDMQGAADAKSKLERGQRAMRERDAEGRGWRSLFYESSDSNDTVAEHLAGKIGLSLNPAETLGAWKFRLKDWQDGKFKKPYHGDLRPDSTLVSTDGGNKQSPDTYSNHKQANGTGSINGMAPPQPAATRTNSGTSTASKRPAPGKANVNEAPRLGNRGGFNSNDGCLGAGGMTSTEEIQVESFLKDK